MKLHSYKVKLHVLPTTQMLQIKGGNGDSQDTANSIFFEDVDTI